MFYKLQVNLLRLMYKEAQFLEYTYQRYWN